MRQKWNDWLWWLGAVVLLGLLSCSSGGGGSTAQVSINMAPASGTSSVNQGSNAQINVTVSNTAAAPACNISAGPGSLGPVTGSNPNFSVTYTAPTAGNTQASVTISCTVGSVSTQLTLTVPVPSASISSPASGTVVSGNALTVSVSASGMTALGFTLKVDAVTVGSEVPAANNAATILWNTATASNGNHALAVVARSSLGSVNSPSATVTVSNSSNAPVLTSTALSAFYSLGPGIAGGITVTGAGFDSSTSLGVNPSSLFGGSNSVNSTTMQLGVQQCNPACDPGMGALTATNNSGTSNILWMMFPSVAPTGDCSVQVNSGDPLECYLLDSVNNKIYAYDQASASLLRTLNIGSEALALTFDPVSKQLIYTTFGGGGIGILNADGSAGGGESFASPGGMFAPAAADGFGCVSRPGAGQIIYFTMGGVVSSFSSVTLSPAGSQPSPVAMTMLGSQAVCATYDLKNNQLVVLKIPQGTVLGQSTVSGISPPGMFAGEGGWYLTYVGSTLALVSRPDNLVVFFDGSTAVETRRAMLPGRAIALSASNGKAEVALQDLTTGGTKLIQVDPANGNIVSLTVAASFGATVLKVDSADTTVFLGNRKNFEKSGNN